MNVLRRTLFTPSKKISSEVLRNGTTHDLLQELGYIKQSHAGLVHWLPLGLRTLRNVEDVVRKKMEESGAHEVQLSTLSSKLLWERTDRWNNHELFKLKDGKGASFCLSPTCEEEMTWLMKGYLQSYKDLPLIVYQITRKYRDELRPRGGLLRGREFLMKDAYSFHLDSSDAIKTFHKMNDIYSGILKEFRLPFVSAVADCANMGGEMSKEYHYLSDGGEDVLYTCDSCAHVSNIEKCSSMPIESAQMASDVNVRYALNQEHDVLICFYYPAKRIFNWNLALDALENDIDRSLKNVPNDKVIEIFLKQNEDPIFSSIVRVMDTRLSPRCNLPEFPLKQYLKNNFSQLNGYTLVDAEEGELCGECGKGTLKASKSIELCHTFYLGRRYSEPLNATIRSTNNDKVTIEMGSYGIGISRLLAAVAQVSKDHLGLCWPSTIAPYKISLNYAQDDENVKTVKNLLRFDPFIDTSASATLGTRLQLSQQLGIPLSVIVGKKSWPKVEIEVRGKRFSNLWIQHHAKSAMQYSWDYIPANPAEHSLEKHHCLPEHLNDVLTILLQDL
ncbi:putative proline--tRNA ligase AIM10 Ecym_4707 [Eremothecium cymbalariae DBVPG|uniref:proline--tRNA ligase n=1 Tax=Eremothecium cymbalariae (strain CBS 270.75 / DBVPG 7215 / KCTC 17166 / NRRL Y-17582) TaxID=931890 RepID=G8JSK5_ERECY|nr:hypothetical protein Ecym_4707 [Eremothecium cymbalariae DBVPG\